MVDLSGVSASAAANWKLIIVVVFFLVTFGLTWAEWAKGDCVPKGDKTGWKALAISQWVFTLLTLAAAYSVWG